ncbi:acyl-coenzyme A thioesterase 9, mitochondrial-like [Ctenocephalides felis]|nr:acyl-coenzyme A thioesterase 9, mitochondrial-like [Ctenocephalides felis]
MRIMGVEPGFKPLLQSREHLAKFTPKSQSELPSRSMQDSFTSAVIPLSSDTTLQDKYVTFLGHVRLGRLMEDMDLFAVWVVNKHLVIPNLQEGIPLPYTLVTVLVDEIDFTDYIPKHDADIRLSGHVSWVGKSSVEVVVWLEQQSHGSWQKITRALFLMAARNPSNTGAAVVNPLQPSTDEERQIFEGGLNRKMRRQKISQESLFKVIPNESEQRTIHDLFIQTIETNDQSFTSRSLPPSSMWMENAKLSNLVFSHPEDRNLHNKVFGGFLMRHALELSWAAGYLHSKHRPKLEHISDISFHKPVDVSSLLRMHAYIVYTELKYMQIVVYTDVYDPNTGSSNTTNVFHYTYSIPDKMQQVIPKTYHEAMMYLDGRRRFQHVKNLNTLGV